MASEPTSEVTRKYEGVVILHPDTTEADQKNLFKRNSDIIKSFKGEMNHLDTWGKRKLANPINKLARGIYFHTTFTAKGDCIKELERTMGINDRVLRFTHVRLDDRVSLAKFVEEFKASLAETIKREQEREAKMQARRAQGGGFRDREGGGGRGDRGDRDGGGRGDREGGGRGEREGGYRRGGRDDVPRDFEGGDEGDGE